ncbi:PKD domain-containing protein [Thermus sp.]|uniref:PKD domain-containing protein n=1 Tax=Thermus sp. TaxID=275 RepID=UPI0029ADFF02|nr:PKD domain-containing protein [Thermus sp.]
MGRTPLLLALGLALVFSACNQIFPNQPPRIVSFEAIPQMGEAPLATRFAWSVQDPEGDALTCTLETGDGTRVTSCSGNYTHTYAIPGEYTARLRVTDSKGGSAQRETQVQARPKRGFTLTLSPTGLTIQQGSSGTITLTLTPQGGFSGSVALSLERQDGTPAPQGLALSPSFLSVSGANPITQVLTLNVGQSVAPSTYPLRVKASSGSLTQTASLTLTVTQGQTGSFSLSLEGTSLSVAQGGTVYVRLVASGSYSGQVSLSLVDASKNTFTGAMLSPTSTPVPSAPMLAITASPNLAPGTYNLFLRGTGGSLVQDVPFALTVTQAAPPPSPDFSLSLSPTGLTVQQGSSGTTTLTVTPSGGFAGTLSLSLVGAPSGVTLSPTSLNVAGSPVTQTLTLQVASGVTPGTYNLKVRGTGGSISREADLTLTVTPPPGFTLSLNPTSLTVQQGQSGTTALTLTPQGGFTGAVALSLVGAPQGVTLSPTSVSVTGTGPVTQTLTLSVGGGVAPGTYPLKVQATGGGVSKEADLSLAVSGTALANLRLAKAEWGQTVLKEGLRLVAGKPALLRVHLLASPSPIPLSTPLAGAVYLNGSFQGNLSFSCPNPIPTATDPGNLASTCTATLPEGWVAPGLRVELRADPLNQVAESDEGDNLLALTANVGTGTVLHLTVVPVVHGGGQGAVPAFRDTLWRIWPLREVSSSTRAPYTFSGTLTGNDSSGWSRLLDELRLLRQADGSGRYYYGFVRVSYTSGIAGIGYIGFPVAVGWDYPSSAPSVMAHELGHNFGRDHAPCGTSGDPGYPYPGGRIGTWGYDLASGTLRDPSAHYDLMSYCGPQWISDYTYEAAQRFLENNPPRPQALPEEGLLFSGRIQGGKAVFNPPLRLQAAPEGEASPYRLRADGVEAPVYTLRDSEGVLHFQARLPLGSYARAGLYLGESPLGEITLPLLPQAEPRVEAREEGGVLWLRVGGYPYFSLFHLAEDGTRTGLALWHPAGEGRFALEGLPPGGQFEVQLTDGLRVLVLRLPR